LGKAICRRSRRHPRIGWLPPTCFDTIKADRAAHEGKDLRYQTPAGLSKAIEEIDRRGK